MSEFILNTRSLPEPLFQLIQTEQVKVREVDGIVHLVPLEDEFDSTFGLRGMLAGCEEMSVKRFLARRRLDEELEP